MRGKDSYIGRLHSDIGMVTSDSGIFSEYREVTGTPPGKDMGLMGHRREANQPTRGWCAPHKRGGQFRLGKGAPPPLIVLLGLLPCEGRANSMWAGVLPSYGPYIPPGGYR